MTHPVIPALHSHIRSREMENLSFPTEWEKIVRGRDIWRVQSEPGHVRRGAWGGGSVDQEGDSWAKRVMGKLERPGKQNGWII